MKKIRPPFQSYPLFYAAVAVLYAVVFIGAEFIGSPIAGLRGFLTLVMQWILVSIAAAAVMGLISINRWGFALLYPPLITVSAVAAYFKLTMGASVTPAVIELAHVNSLSTWLTLASPLLITVIVIALTFAVFVAVYRVRHVRKPCHAWVWATAFAIIAILPVYIQRIKAPVIARMPYSFAWSIKDWRDNRREIAVSRTTYDNVPSSCADSSLTVVFIIGESLRPDHLQLNGYARPTTPRLNADTAVVSLPGMHTGPYYTHTSVPHIVTRADSLNPHRATVEQSFITLFNRAGFHTGWLSNQDEVAAYAYFMHEADTLVRVNASRSLYDFSPHLDADLLPALKAFVRRKNRHKMAVLHCIGSHWWYGSHYLPEHARFKPEADSRIISELSAQQIINSYDNTIIATDAFLANVTDMLRDSNAIMIFVSDHGEALGENGNYLHAADYPQLHNCAALVWYSPKYASQHPDRISSLRRNRLRNYSTDVIFHSVLDAASISTPVLNHEMSIFR